MTVRPLHKELSSGAAALGLDLNAERLDQLLDYLDLLQKWGKVYNLTSVREPTEMLTHHLLDSLAIVRPLAVQVARLGLADRARLLDVGSGAGLPGVVLAICCPHIDVWCVDTVSKKAAFIQQVAMSLQLPNLKGIHARVENLPETYDVVVSRAFASLKDFTHLSTKQMATGALWLAMKGKMPDAEVAGLLAPVQVFHVEQLVVPGLDAERCLVWMRPTPA